MGSMKDVDKAGSKAANTSRLLCNVGIGRLIITVIVALVDNRLICHMMMCKNNETRDDHTSSDVKMEEANEVSVWSVIQ